MAEVNNDDADQTKMAKIEKDLDNISTKLISISGIMNELVIKYYTKEDDEVFRNYTSEFSSILYESQCKYIINKLT